MRGTARSVPSASTNAPGAWTPPSGAAPEPGRGLGEPLALALAGQDQQACCPQFSVRQGDPVEIRMKNAHCLNLEVCGTQL